MIMMIDGSIKGGKRNWNIATLSRYMSNYSIRLHYNVNCITSIECQSMNSEEVNTCNCRGSWRIVVLLFVALEWSLQSSATEWCLQLSLDSQPAAAKVTLQVQHTDLTTYLLVNRWTLSSIDWLAGWLRMNGLPLPTCHAWLIIRGMLIKRKL